MYWYYKKSASISTDVKIDEKICEGGGRGVCNYGDVDEMVF